MSSNHDVVEVTDSNGIRLIQLTIGWPQQAEQTKVLLYNHLAPLVKTAGMSRGDLKHAIEGGYVIVNGQVMVSRTCTLQRGDVVCITVDMISHQMRLVKAMNLRVAYYNGQDVVVVWKPAGRSITGVQDAIPYLLVLEGHEESVHVSGGNCAWKSLYSLDTPINGLAVLALKGSDAFDRLSNQLTDGRAKFMYRMVCHNALDLPNPVVPAQDIRPNNAHSINKAIDGGGCATKKCPTANTSPSLLEPGPAREEWLRSRNIARDVLAKIWVRTETITPSSSAGRLSTLTVTTEGGEQSLLAVRKLLHDLGYPVVGEQSYAKPLLGGSKKGSFIALLGVQFYDGDNKDKPVHVGVPEPTKFEASAPAALSAACAQEHRVYPGGGYTGEMERHNKALEEGLTTGTGNVDYLVPETEFDPTVTRPVAYTVGKKEFCGFQFYVNPSTLIPRPSTQTLVYASIAHLSSLYPDQVLPNLGTDDGSTGISRESAEKGRWTRADLPAKERPRIKVLDLGTGTGCILISLLKQLPCTSLGVGIDICESALEVAKQNTVLHNLGSRVTLARSSFENFASNPHVLSFIDAHGPFDLIVSNPPYHSPHSLQRMSTSSVIDHEPALALIAEDGGFQAYKHISCSLRAAPQILRPGGLLVLEVGKSKHHRVEAIFEGWRVVAQRQDNHGFIRCLVLQRSSDLA
ncbi:hypothetical protein EV182_000296 [Spiromyces aspiralis]|uniref:Uncharacterized protein n=1 Tax=Spiromyces aspiralis TaxID=68401 RepID=A0ACC1HHH9_9FUNG|nr:hypothetical protein EV182_000296 [Spiromyces aspiralis]